MTDVKENQLKPTIEFSDLTGLRLQIWGLLNVYPELSFTELAKKLGKSKSTIHPHIQKLIEVGIIEISKKEHVRANIEAHYYSLTPDAEEITSVLGFDFSNGLDKDLVQKLAKSRKSFAIYNRKLLDRFIKFCEFLEENDSDDVVEIFKQNYKATNFAKQDVSTIHSGSFFLTENQWKEWQKAFYKLGMDFQEQWIKEQKENPNQEKYIYFYNIGIPVKILFEEYA